LCLYPIKHENTKKRVSSAAKKKDDLTSYFLYEKKQDQIVSHPGIAGDK
jgi:hypothetical protein